MIMKNLLIFCLRFLIFFCGSWVGAAMMRQPSLKKRLSGRHPPSKVKLSWVSDAHPRPPSSSTLDTGK